MFVNIVIFAFAIVACSAEQAAPAAPTPPPPSPQAAPVLCSEPPDNLFTCVSVSSVVGKVISIKARGLSECDRMKSLFRESGWALPGDKVNKAKVAESFTQYAVDHPEWAAAVSNLKVTCLGDKDLPAQGTQLDCAPYDVVHCIMTSFIKNAAPSQWKETPQCSYARSYAKSCPYCPSDCFAPQVPYGSCNACLALPRSP